MDTFQDTDVFLMLGQKGCGKSYLSRKVQECYPRVVIFDTLFEYDEPENTVFNFSQFSERLLVFERENINNFRLIFQFDPESDFHEYEFDQAIRVLYYRGDVQIVIEEVQNFASVHSMPKWLNRSILTGRHQVLSLIFTTQRPGELHKSLLSQCRHIFIGSLFEKNDIDYCRAVLGDKAFELPNLKPREFIYFSPGQIPVKITNDFKNLSENTKKGQELPLNTSNSDESEENSLDYSSESPEDVD